MTPGLYLLSVFVELGQQNKNDDYILKIIKEV